MWGETFFPKKSFPPHAFQKIFFKKHENVSDCHRKWMWKYCFSYNDTLSCQQRHVMVWKLNGESIMNSYLVTGGAGFIGSCFVLQSCVAGRSIINVDKLTYAGNMDNLAAIANDKNHVFIHGDIGNEELMAHALRTHAPDAIVNFAAESHVDRSIVDPDAFVRTNVLGTCVLLRVALKYWQGLAGAKREAFRFLHVSTDEVFGTLSLTDPPFTEDSPYAPNSPYSASKAASDHLVRSFHETYGLPILITNCSNNYGPRQFPEKLIPLMMCQALDAKALPIYGKGDNIRDWLHVEDHCTAIEAVLQRGTVGRTYNIGGRAERTNMEVVTTICKVLDHYVPRKNGVYTDLISFVPDRPGHDFRYAIDCTRMENELGWTPAYTFDEGILETVRWYLDNQDWLTRARSGAYQDWLQKNYTARTHERA